MNSSRAKTDNPPPHDYKTQRRMEREALRARQNGHDKHATLPPMCGYTYLPTKPKRIPPDQWKPQQTICARTAGAGTSHHGTGYCDYHDWKSAQEGQRADKQRSIKTARDLAYKNAKFFGAPKPTDPHTALMDEIARTAGIIAWTEDLLTKMKEEGRSDEDILTQYNVKFGLQPSAWWQMLIEERKHLVTTCVAAIKAGVAERKVQIAEQQGRIIVHMMMSFIHDRELGLSPLQIMDAPRLIRKHLNALPMQAAQHPAETIIETQGKEI